MQLDETAWQQRLSPEQYAVLRQRATEPPFSGKYVHTTRAGTYACAGCGNILFDAKTKFDSGTGWPSFYKARPGAIVLRADNSSSMIRTEVICAKCGGHLGHVFDDAPLQPTGQRYCINSAALTLQE